MNFPQEFSSKPQFFVCYFDALRFCFKKVFLKTSQNSQENTCARVTFLINLLFNKKETLALKKILWHRCFPVNFAKFLRTAFFVEHIQWLLLSLSRGQSHSQTRGSPGTSYIEVRSLSSAEHLAWWSDPDTFPFIHNALTR